MSTPHTSNLTVAPSLQTVSLSNQPGSKPPRRGASEQILARRDIDVLCWLAHQYAARVDQVQQLLGCGERQAQRVLSRLRAHGLVTCERILLREPPWVLPTTAGVRLSATGFRVWEPSLALLGHVAAVNDVRLHVEHRSPESVWTSERQLARKEGLKKHLVDAVVLLDGQNAAIEVELTPKSKARTTKIIDGLCARYDVVLYFAAPEAHENLTDLAGNGRWPTLGIRELPTTVGDRS